MTKNIIDYYYAPISGYAYLGEPRLVKIAEDTHTELRFKPVDIGKIFAKSNTTAPFKQSPQRIAYRFQDMQRIADHLGLPIHPKPLHWPVPVELSAKTIYACIELGAEPHGVSFAILSAVYARQLNVADPDTITTLLRELGLEVEAVEALATSAKITKQYEAATDEAIDLGIFGSPTYVLNNEEIFFGQDRLELLSHSL